jgi:hypothetical protein
MLTIKDLSASRELDCEARSEILGGGDVYSANTQNSLQNGVAGLVAVNESTQDLFAINEAVDWTYDEEVFVGIGQFGAAIA